MVAIGRHLIVRDLRSGRLNDVQMVVSISKIIYVCAISHFGISRFCDKSDLSVEATYLGASCTLKFSTTAELRIQHSCLRFTPTYL